MLPDETFKKAHLVGQYLDGIRQIEAEREEAIEAEKRKRNSFFWNLLNGFPKDPEPEKTRNQLAAEAKMKFASRFETQKLSQEEISRIKCAPHLRRRK